MPTPLVKQAMSLGAPSLLAWLLLAALVTPSQASEAGVVLTVGSLLLFVCLLVACCCFAPLGMYFCLCRARYEDHNPNHHAGAKDDED